MTVKTLSDEQLVSIYLKAIEYKTDQSFRNLLFEEITTRSIQHLISIHFYYNHRKTIAT
ncbi:sporulation histidine kinase inhibitor Sda [Bacillus oleivorans]|uniref:sporulation histidine kinase inhibitor Sda n=1 Tax=Bacillus oleivorans TaxID=1448271 RepID=UPI000BE3D478